MNRNKALILALLTFIVTVPSTLAFAETVLVKDADVLRLEQELDSSEDVDVLRFEIALQYLERRTITEAARMAALKLLELSAMGRADGYLREFAERISTVDPALAVSVKLALARRGLRKCSSLQEEREFLGQEIRREPKKDAPRSVLRWLAEELCDRGALEYFEDIERIFSSYRASPRVEARFRLCREQMSLLNGGEDVLIVFRSVLVSEDITPGMRLHEWAIKSLLRMDDPRADEELISYALRWQESDWPRARSVFYGLKQKGWTEEQLADRGWHSTQPGVRALQSKRATEEQP